jgi:phytoene synthase
VALAGPRRVKDTASARLTRASGTSFYYAFRILPEERRRAIFALYSFCRVVDDCVDEPGGEGEAGLRRWMEEVRRCYAGAPATELGRDLAEAVARYPIPRACFEDIVEGCRMDLAIRRYPTFGDLRVYCERVASAVGLASIEIFGYANPQTRRYAVELGVALQLTNILRDVAADAARGRLYVPLEDLDRFRVPEEQLLRPEAAPPSAQLRLLLAYQAERAREHYEAAAGLLPPEDRRAMTPAEMMAAVYRQILDELTRRGYPVHGARVTLSRPRKAWAALRALVRSRLPA